MGRTKNNGGGIYQVNLAHSRSQLAEWWTPHFSTARGESDGVGARDSQSRATVAWLYRTGEDDLRLTLT